VPHTIIHAKTNVPGRAPDGGVIDNGEIAINTIDGKLFIKKNAVIYEVGSEKIAEVNGTISGIAESTTYLTGTNIDVSDNNIYSKTLSAPTTFSFSGWTTNATAIRLEVNINVDPAPAMLFPGVTFRSEPLLSPGLNVFIFTSTDNGSTINGYALYDEFSDVAGLDAPTFEIVNTAVVDTVTDEADQFDYATYLITRSAGLPAASVINIALSGTQGALLEYYNGTNWLTPGTTISIAEGVNEIALRVSAIQDTIYEDSESFLVTISTPTVGTIGTSSVSGTVLNDDPRSTSGTTSWSTAWSTGTLQTTSRTTAFATDWSTAKSRTTSRSTTKTTAWITSTSASTSRSTSRTTSYISNYYATDTYGVRLLGPGDGANSTENDIIDLYGSVVTRYAEQDGIDYWVADLNDFMLQGDSYAVALDKVEARMYEYITFHGLDTYAKLMADHADHWCDTGSTFTPWENCQRGTSKTTSWTTSWNSGVSVTTVRITSKTTSWTTGYTGQTSRSTSITTNWNTADGVTTSRTTSGTTDWNTTV